MNKTILKASAGTGKTYRLSLEFIANLIKGVKYDNIVVMTFTKKATAEIKERIYDFLYEVAFNKGNGKELENNLKEIYKFKENEIKKEKLQEIYFEMIKNKEDIRIYTIDGFINKVFKLAIAPTFSIYNYETIDNEEDSFYEDILKKVLNDKKMFEKMKFFIEEKGDKKNIDTYVEFIKSIIFLQKNYLLTKNINEIEKQIINTLFVDNIEKTFENIEEIQKKKKKENDIEFINSDFREIYGKFKEINGKSEKNEIETKKEKIDIVMKNWEIFFEKNIWNGKKIRGKEVQDKIDELVELKKEILKSLQKYIFSEKIVPTHKKLKEFSEKLYEMIEKIKINSKKFTHDDVSIYTYKFIFDENLKFVENGKINGEFLELIGGHIETIMIDEFQDTSILQWKILKLLIDCAKNVICVGDEKQSIYGWRGGEKELFERLENIIDGKVETLDKSYRSYKEIIENVNKIYDGYRKDWDYTKVQYRSDEDYQRGYFYYNLQNAKKLDDNEEKIRNYDIIINMIKNKKIKNLGKSCIICRNNSHLNEIVQKLNEENIPYTLTSNATMLEHSAIKPLYKLIKYFLYNNSIYLLEFLRSDLIGCLNTHIKYYLENKETIEKYINNYNNEKFSDFVENIEDENVKIKMIEYKQIDKLERNNLIFSNILEKIKKLKQLSKQLNSIHLKENFSNEIIKTFEVTNYYNTNSDIKNIFTFFNILKEYKDLFEFVNYIEENKEKMTQLSSQDVDAINLMTIHKSKGLEFDTVFYYKRDKEKEDTEKNELISFVEYDENFENVKNFLVIFKKYNKIFVDGHYFNLKNKNEIKKEIEEINSDYVALTRAKKNLIVLMNYVIDKEKGFKNSLVKKLIDKYKSEDEDENENENEKSDVYEYENGEIIESEKQNNDNQINIEKIDRLLQYFEENKIKEIKGESQLNLEGEFKRKKGLAIHYYFEHLHNNLEEDKKIAKSSYYNKYGNMLGKEILEELLERIEKCIEKNKEIYNKEYKVYTEFEIYDENGDKKIIDRLNIDEKNKKIFIYDYKTGYEPLENKKYIEQLDNYKKILENKLGNEYEIKTGILEV